jgi:SAM-dependent methyltransferase
LKLLHTYNEYEQYLTHQKKKTEDPVRREKWLTQEWDLKLDGFKTIFSNLLRNSVLEKNQRALCIGARTGQEIVALRKLGLEASGIDIVPHEDLVLEGDMHDLQYEDSSFDFVFSNVFDHSLYPEKMISEIERVLKVDGHCLIQFQLKIPSDEYSENEIESIDHDVLSLFEQSKIIHSESINRNFAGMNWEILMQKDEVLSNLFAEVGRISDLSVPAEYKQIWNDINLPIQMQKGKNYNLDKEYLDECLDKLHKRAYYLVSIANFIGAKNILEVGTAQGWQYYSFVKHAKENDGHVWSCDIKDVRDSKYVEDCVENNTFVLGTSKELAQTLNKSGEKIDLFYVDGSHQAKAVLNDILNLKHLQSDNCAWVFDDFDLRFGCYREIHMLRKLNNRYKIYRVGDAASGNPNHQVVVFGKL